MWNYACEYLLNVSYYCHMPYVTGFKKIDNIIGDFLQVNAREEN